MAQRLRVAAAVRFPTVSIRRRLWLIAGLAFLLPSSAQAADDPDNQPQSNPTSLSWKLEASHAGLGSRESDFYVRFRIQAIKGKPEGRQPLTLALVFDRSGSMDAEHKIGYGSV